MPIPLILAIRVLMRIGSVRVASLMLSFSLWLIFSLIAVQQGGIHAPVIRNYIIVILVAGVLSGLRSAIGFSGLVLLSAALMYMVQFLGLWHFPILLPPSNETVFISLFLTITLAGLLVSLATRGTDEALKKTKENLLVAQEAAHLGSMDRDFRTGKGWWSDEFYRILGRVPQECEPLLETFLGHIHPEDLELQNEIMAAVRSKAMVRRLSHRIIRPDGEIRSVLGQLQSFADGSGTPIRIIGTLLDVTERKAIEDALRESEKTTRALLNAHTGVAILVDTEGTILAINEPLARSRFGKSAEEIMGSCVWDLYPSDVGEARRALGDEVIRSGEPLRYTDTLAAGRIMDCQMCPVVNEQGEVTRVAVYATDITAIKTLEEQLLQSQKMEAIGTLAGGVAHDFNNILTGIMGYSDLLSLKLSDYPATKADLSQVQQLAERASKLTAQLLLFSRQQAMDPTSLDLNVVVKNTLEMLEPIIGEDIELQFIPDPDLGTIRADESQLGQILLNLATNARDAMATGGALTIETSNVTLDRKSANVLVGEVEPGSYVLWRISDTGDGMDAATQ